MDGRSDQGGHDTTSETRETNNEPANSVAKLESPRARPTPKDRKSQSDAPSLEPQDSPLQAQEAKASSYKKGNCSKFKKAVRLVTFTHRIAVASRPTQVA